MDDLAQKVHRAITKVKDPEPLVEALDREWPGFTEELLLGYRDPQYVRMTGGDRVCTRCGALVHAGGKQRHSDWHRLLTLSFNVLSASDKALLEEISGEKTKAKAKFRRGA